MNKPESDDTAPHQLQCMEVWGGNWMMDSGVMMPGVDAWIHSKPFGEDRDGGDVHYVSSCATGRITRFMVADVSGHGDEAAQVANQLRLLMQRYINYISQDWFLQEINRYFSASTSGTRFATAVAITYFYPTRSIVLSNAGHPPPMLYCGRNRNWSATGCIPASSNPASDLPLGILDDASYSTENISLTAGDMVLCYTDSLIECRDAAGKPIGVEGLQERINTLDISRPGSLIKRLLAHLASEYPGNLEDDDITVLLFKPNSLVLRMPMKERMLAPWRVARGMIRSLRRGDHALPWPEISVQNIGGALLDSLNRSRDKENR